MSGRIDMEYSACLCYNKELVRMMKGTHEKGWTWVNTGAEMLCMLLNKSGNGLRDELNLALGE